MAKKVTTPNTQRDIVVVLIIALIIGLSGGYALGSLNDSDDMSNTQTTEQTDTASHPHMSKYEVETENAPKVELVVSEDAKSGYNIAIIATDFTFTPEKVNSENVMGEGHAHLYVDGVKIARLYSPYFHYDSSFEGTKTFRVTLNANDHSEYALNGATIESEIQVTHNSNDPAHTDSHETDDESHTQSDM